MERQLLCRLLSISCISMEQEELKKHVRKDSANITTLYRLKLEKDDVRLSALVKETRVFTGHHEKTEYAILEDKGFLGHKAITARCFQYFARISREEYRGGSLANVVNKFFGKSYLSAVSALVKSEKVSIEDLKELIREVEENNQQ